MAEIEEKIAALEKARAQVEEELQSGSADHVHLQQLSARYQELEAELGGLYGSWRSGHKLELRPDVLLEGCANMSSNGQEGNLLASPRGLCAGVVRAVDIVQIALELYNDEALYVRKEIVHNPHVVEDLCSRGVIFVDELTDVPDGQRVIFSAHSVLPAVWEVARKKRLRVIDATCPLVTKVHTEARRFASKDYTIVLIGHPGHEEVKGPWGKLSRRCVCQQPRGSGSARV